MQFQKLTIFILTTFWCLVCDAYYTKDLANSSTAALKSKLSNFTFSDQYQPYDYRNYERDPRQWFTGYGGGYYPSSGYGLMGGLDSLLIGVMAILGIGIIGFPFLLLCLTMFTGGAQNGLNFVPPTTTTTVNGRKKRSASMFPELNANLREKVLEILDRFSKVSESEHSFNSQENNAHN
ncbi:hypothetical protein B4U80_02598 [Leptotrombidium deliense]|uniref:Uncharacterized protein n=1 Tax=Leptotrombidium deliense TaxID=299467 RepID=A0A443SWD7_9ACAR|nr:hypothetical protein B4U80_02598 [Leptotrombidium deliense]